MEEGPPAKRQRRSKPGGAGLSKRARDPEDATTPVKRSRKRANELAEVELASADRVTDRSLLRVLRAWKFTQNVNRANVMPRGASFVLSDTLGLVSTRQGVVVVSRLTKLYPAVFKLMASWVAGAWPSSPRFVWSSISVNSNYAARIHRDALNVGPSLTRAFGDFQGGGLKYWGQDDGCLSLEELRTCPSTVLSTGSALCLFDGRRAHEVEPFSGERYSLVFFCTGALNRAREDALSYVRLCGAHVPTSVARCQSGRYLCPAKGYDMRGKQQLGIQEMCGRAAKPSCVMWKLPRLLDLGNECLDRCLSFVVTPPRMSELCAVAKAMSAACWRPASWDGSIVDGAGRRPTGRLAVAHWKLWRQTTAVIGGAWERGNVSFLIDRFWTAWSFAHEPGTDVLVSLCPVPAHDVSVLFNIHTPVDGQVLVGVSNTRCHREIKAALASRRVAPGVVAIAAVLSSGRCKAFRRNGRTFGPGGPAIGRIEGVLRFSLLDRRVAIQVPGIESISAKAPPDLPAESSFHAFVLLPPSAYYPGSVSPCWSRVLGPG